MSGGSTAPTIAEVCVVACADVWRGDGEILASPIGTVPMIAVRLAASTFEPDLVYTDGDALLLAEPLPVGPTAADAPKHVEGWMPFRNVFDVVWSGKRHVMMGATQVDRYGNQNIACIGPWQKPTARVFVESVDCVSGVGYDRAAAAGPTASEFHEIRRVVSNKGVFDFETPDHSMRLRSVHPGVPVDDLVQSTGFELVIPDDVPETRLPTNEELHLIRDVLDPDNLRDTEVKA